MDKQREEKDLKACRTEITNSYLKCLFGDAQLAYMFFSGVRYGRTGEMPNSLLDDEEFVNGTN